MTITFSDVLTGEKKTIKNVTHIESVKGSVVKYMYNIFDEYEDKYIKTSMIEKIDWED